MTQNAFPAASFDAAWAHGYRRVLILWALRARRVGGRNGSLRLWAALSFVPAFPPAIYALGAGEVDRKRVLAFCAVLAFTTAGAIGAAFTAWRRVAKRGPAISGLCSDHDAACIATPLTWGYRREPQAGVALVGVAVGLTMLALGSADLGWPTPLRLLVSLPVAMTAAVVAINVYWLLLTPLLAWRLAKVDCLDLRWNDPANSPGIRALAEGYVESGLLMSALAAAVAGPQLFGVVIFGDAMPIVYWTIVGVTAWIGAVPLLLLMMKVHDHKMVALDALSATRPQFNATGDLDDVEEFASTYAAVASAPLLPVGIGTAIPFMAFLATSLAGFFQG